MEGRGGACTRAGAGLPRVCKLQSVSVDPSCFPIANRNQHKHVAPFLILYEAFLKLDIYVHKGATLVVAVVVDVVIVVE